MLFKKIYKCIFSHEIDINEAVPYVVCAVIKEPWSILSLDISFKEKKKNSKITIGLYNILLLLLILLVFLLILFSGGITIGQMAPPPIFIGNIYGLPIKTDSLTISADGTFIATLKMPVYNKSLLSGRLSIRNINFVPVSTKFVCTPNKSNNNIFSHSILDEDLSNGFIFPLNKKLPTDNDKILIAKKVTLVTENKDLRQLEHILGRYGEAEAKLGAWLPPGKNEFLMLIKGDVDFEGAKKVLNETLGSNCINGVVRSFVVDVQLDFNMRYFLGSISYVQQDIGYVLFPACNK
ncbi:unnamed protein product [Cryptosporidium hominis]|uniref:Uncharacterized protein n=1 Tax=Cryptosporidium hominis TaxID=237895 RepID=A0A0S4TB03_CRYHO|nr:hypothetical protein [Cryptosporidium hominis TU502]OLQ18726.1 hypothetical protein ChTU502y2012_412g0495 [Cryptosporidium hominis]PPA62494.1 hypothetical protein ChUKH1_13270 [Cryptosporidium hominis]PPS97256.1 Uncharacterized protein GY17_00001259 [Cryptosporidium hominis]CUV04193.1 unnamed protein product [Cryptosporidium hominis]|eukprot:PPS97256.1 Uncharacterized protein GY17_00001259 [Cryptosporidium hominis]